MSNMQKFHNWLSSTNQPQSTVQRRLKHLTQVSRPQIVKATNAMTWAIWDEKASALS